MSQPLARRRRRVHRKAWMKRAFIMVNGVRFTGIEKRFVSPWMSPENFNPNAKPLTVELLESAHIASLKAAKEPVPCIACGTPTVDCGRWVGVYQKGLGPACVKCYNEAQENMLTEESEI